MAQNENAEDGEFDVLKGYQWFGMHGNLANMSIKGRGNKKYASIELRVPLDPFFQGTEDLRNIQGRLIWGIQKDDE